MINCTREISKEIFDKAKTYGNSICREDRAKVFSKAELYGYGVYGTSVYEKEGKYYVRFERGCSCD